MKNQKLSSNHNVTYLNLYIYIYFLCSISLMIIKMCNGIWNNYIIIIFKLTSKSLDAQMVSIWYKIVII